MTSPPLFVAMLGSLAAALAITVPASAMEAPDSSCSTQAASAAITVQVPADYPLIAAEQNISGSALVQVALTLSGAVRSATIAESSGNEFLDQAAVLAARQQTYSPQIVDCRPVGGSYLVAVDFRR
jgi:TonB family protein